MLCISNPTLIKGFTLSFTNVMEGTAHGDVISQVQLSEQTLAAGLQTAKSTLHSNSPSDQPVEPLLAAVRVPCVWVHEPLH